MRDDAALGANVMEHGEYAICVTSGYRMSSAAEAEAIVYMTGGVTAARFIVGVGRSQAGPVLDALRERAEARARAWIEADEDERATMQSFEHVSPVHRSAFWRKRGL